MLNSEVFSGKDEARGPVALRVLLPVDEMLRRRDAQRIARDARAAMRRRAQPDDLRAELHTPIIEVARDVVETGENGHCDLSKPYAPDAWLRCLHAPVYLPLL